MTETRPDAWKRTPLHGESPPAWQVMVPKTSLVNYCRSAAGPQCVCGCVRVCVSLLLLGEIRSTVVGQDSLCRSHLWSICSVSLASALIAGLEGDGGSGSLETQLRAVLTCSPVACHQDGEKDGGAGR